MNDFRSNQSALRAGQRLPLQDLVFLNTRPVHQARELTQLLESLGGEVIELPLLEILPMESRTKQQLKICLEEALPDTWLVFTSSNGVEEVCRQVLDPETETLAGKKLRVLPTAVIGEKTAQVARQRGLSVSFVSEEENSNDFSRAFVQFLSKAFSSDTLPKILVLRSKVANEDLLRNFTSARVDFTCLDVYDSRASVADLATLQNLMFRQGLEQIDLVIFSSSLAVKVFFQQFVALSDGRSERSSQSNAKTTMSEQPCAVIGPRTRAVAEELGFPVVVMPRHASVQALVDEIVKYFEED